MASSKIARPGEKSEVRRSSRRTAGRAFREWRSLAAPPPARRPSRARARSARARPARLSASPSGSPSSLVEPARPKARHPGCGRLAPLERQLAGQPFEGRPRQRAILSGRAAPAPRPSGGSASSGRPSWKSTWASRPSRTTLGQGSFCPGAARAPFSKDCRAAGNCPSSAASRPSCDKVIARSAILRIGRPPPPLRASAGRLRGSWKRRARRTPRLCKASGRWPA